MRNLDDRIAEWRTRMAAGGIKTPAVLDELESHLREETERQRLSGSDEQKAFEIAEQKIGASSLLKAEFAKVSQTKPARAGRILGIACCLAALPIPIFMVPAFLTIPELTPGERFLGLAAVFVTFFSVASWWFSHRFLSVITNRKLRQTISVACGLAGLASLYLFGALLPGVVVPRLFSGSVTYEYPVFALAITVLWVLAFTAVLGAIAFGLEGAAVRHTKEKVYV